MPDWKTRLAVKFTVKNETKYITPIDSFTPQFSLNAEPLHSIEKTHIGVVFSPEAISFSLTVKTIGDVAGRLTALAMAGTRFDIMLLEEEGEDWSYSTVVLTECIITSASPSNTTIAGAPTASFSGFSLSAKVDPKAVDAVTVP